MKYLKLFEGYFDEDFRNLLNNIKSEVDQYMYSITDEYQFSSSNDFITISNEPGLLNCFKIFYFSIKYNDEFWEKFDKVEKTLKKIFNVQIFFRIKGDTKWGIYNKDEIKIKFNDKKDDYVLTITVLIPNDFNK